MASLRLRALVVTWDRFPQKAAFLVICAPHHTRLWSEVSGNAHAQELTELNRAVWLQHSKSVLKMYPDNQFQLFTCHGSEATYQYVKCDWKILYGFCWKSNNLSSSESILKIGQVGGLEDTLSLWCNQQCHAFYYWCNVLDNMYEHVYAMLHYIRWNIRPRAIRACIRFLSNGICLNKATEFSDFFVFWCCKILLLLLVVSMYTMGKKTDYFNKFLIDFLYIMTQKGVPCIKLFSSTSRVRLVIWMMPHLNIFFAQVL